MQFPLAALWLVAGGIIVGLALSIGAEFLVHWGLGAGRAATILSGLAGVWISLWGACVLASRRYGTGHAFRDLGVSFRFGDLRRGPTITLLALIAVSFVGRLTTGLGPRFEGSNASLLRAPHGDVVGAVALVLAAMTGAPFFEEMFFRGLLQRTLESRFSGHGPAVGQSALFGLVHFQLVLGWRNVGVVVAVATIGLVFGLAVERFRRVGPTVIAHGTFNGLAALALYAARR